MKQKQEPVKREFWEKLLNLDMSVTPSNTLNLEQPQRASSSEINSDEAAIPNSNPDDSNPTDSNHSEPKFGDAVIGVPVEGTSESCPSESAKSDSSKSVNVKTPHIQHSNSIQSITDEQDLPRIATKTKGLILIPDIDLGEIPSERSTSASITNLSHNEPPPSKVFSRTPR